MSALEFDVCLQSYGALVKANVMLVLNRHCQQLGQLYRLVKLWAQVGQGSNLAPADGCQCLKMRGKQV
jgi:hypothetical protein